MKDIIITLAILGCIVAGVIVGWMGILPVVFIAKADKMAWFLLQLMIFLVGIDLGLNHVFRRIKEVGWRMILLPVSVIIGSLLAGVLASVLLVYPLMRSIALTSSMGWYTLSAILFDRMLGPEMGALAFLSNVFREMLTFLLFPIFHRFKMSVPGIAMGGGTTMDTTLVLINRIAGPEFAVLAFFQGLICTMVIPFLITFFLGLSR